MTWRGSYIPGGAYAVCDRCQKRVRIWDLKTEWSNARVCDRCWDPRPVHLSTPHLTPGEGSPLPGSRPDTVQQTEAIDLAFPYRDGTFYDPSVPEPEQPAGLVQLLDEDGVPLLDEDGRILYSDDEEA